MGLDRILRVKAYPNRGTGRGGTTDGEDDRRVVVLTLIANEGDKAKAHELSSHLRSFLPTNDRRKIAEPLECSHGGKTVFLDRCSRATHDGLVTLGDVHESESLGALLVCLVRVERLEVVWWVVRLATDEAAEEGGNNGLRDDDLVVD